MVSISDILTVQRIEKAAKKAISDGYTQDTLNWLEAYKDELKYMRGQYLAGKDSIIPEERDEIIECSRAFRKLTIEAIRLTGSRYFDECYWWSFLFEAPYWFESFLIYMEKDRKPEKRFYEPRRKTLKVVVQDLQDLEDRKIEFLGISLPPRVGKAISFDTPVLTKAGWKKHGELTIQDKVIGADGRYKDILAIHNPCEMEYAVTFSDGESIVCHGNHEWSLYDRHSRKNVNIETKDLFKNGITEKDGRFRYFAIDKAFVVGEEKDLYVDPYTLGAWLGDGRNVNPDICGSESDHAIVQKILNSGYELAWSTKHKTTGVRYYGFKGLREQLQKYGMCHSRRKTPKHIPDEYFTASIEQRLELLAGLLDTDGSLRNKENRYSFTTNEPTLRDGFVSLVSTFGWRASIIRHEKGMSSSGIRANSPYWVVSFNPTAYIPCQLERKQLKKYSQQRRIAVKKIDRIEPGVKGNCITVEGGIYCVGKTLKPTHNSSVCIFFLAWILGKRPNSHNAMSGHSGILADGFYSEIMNLLFSSEYTFHEIFPDVRLQKKSADKKEITLNNPDRFASLTCRGIDGTWTGAVDISSDGYLYVDDMVRDREESLSAIRLENRYQDYLNILVDRKNDGTRELMVGTRWNVIDPLGRVETQFKDDPRYRFRKISALDENDESNFEYKYGVGFSAEYYKNIRERLDNNLWMAKYQQTPFVREGLLFPEDELYYYNGIMPEGDYRVVSACDVAWGGGDSLSMPIAREYSDGSVYVFAWVFSKGTKEETIPEVVGKIIGNKIRQINFEGNNGGEMYKDYVDEKLREQNYKCSCSSSKAPNTMEKMSKIIAYSGDIKRKYYFLDMDHRDAEYRRAMTELNMFVQIGKNAHDDAADGLTQLEMAIEGKYITPEAKVVKNPLYGRG